MVYTLPTFGPHVLDEPRKFGVTFVTSVRKHAGTRGLKDLDILFDNVDRALESEVGARVAS